MCSRLLSHAAHLLLRLQQRGRPLLQPGGHQGPGGTQVGAQRAPGSTDAYGGYSWGPLGGVGGRAERGRAVSRNLLLCCPWGTWSGMVQRGAKAAGIPVWAGVTKEPSPAWSPAPMAASCSAPALRAPWPSTTALPLAAVSCVLQVRHPPLPPAPAQPHRSLPACPSSGSCGGGLAWCPLPAVSCLLWPRHLDAQGRCGFRPHRALQTEGCEGLSLLRPEGGEQPERQAGTGSAHPGVPAPPMASQMVPWAVTWPRGTPAIFWQTWALGVLVP